MAYSLDPLPARFQPCAKLRTPEAVCVVVIVFATVVVVVVGVAAAVVVVVVDSAVVVVVDIAVVAVNAAVVVVDIAVVLVDVVVVTGTSTTQLTVLALVALGSGIVATILMRAAAIISSALRP